MATRATTAGHTSHKQHHHTASHLIHPQNHRCNPSAASPTDINSRWKNRQLKGRNDHAPRTDFSSYMKPTCGCQQPFRPSTPSSFCQSEIDEKQMNITDTCHSPTPELPLFGEQLDELQYYFQAPSLPLTMSNVAIIDTLFQHTETTAHDAILGAPSSLEAASFGSQRTASKALQIIDQVDLSSPTDSLMAFGNLRTPWPLESMARRLEDGSSSTPDMGHLGSTASVLFLPRATFATVLHPIDPAIRCRKCLLGKLRGSLDFSDLSDCPCVTFILLKITIHSSVITAMYRTKFRMVYGADFRAHCSQDHTIDAHLGDESSGLKQHENVHARALKWCGIDSATARPPSMHHKPRFGRLCQELELALCDGIRQRQLQLEYRPFQVMVTIFGHPYSVFAFQLLLTFPRKAERPTTDQTFRSSGFSVFEMETINALSGPNPIDLRERRFPMALPTVYESIRLGVRQGFWVSELAMASHNSIFKLSSYASTRPMVHHLYHWIERIIVFAHGNGQAGA
ncbi:uncharacterized protein CLUP02_16026 [Colletotrichum lupini]|uniref:Uncharacterized protein n=1 Tax=Colletotrichum lupini TaxID=145971 RepID=A0A9Q8T754_9PEZI|nr:uncharacterized protein CLUP02_16026 [Colletotrichum lupini]UQC90496.1 hypothetical protein CLUP02_16026 [Colletotrichum lupini]